MAEQIFIIEDGTLTKYETDAFLDCTLEEIEIPDSVTTIETWAFSGCETLQSITIPESVTSIGPWAIGYRELQFLPYWDPVPFADVPSSYTENQAVKPNDTQKTISGVITNT